MICKHRVKVRPMNIILVSVILHFVFWFLISLLGNSNLEFGIRYNHLTYRFF